MATSAQCSSPYTDDKWPLQLWDAVANRSYPDVIKGVVLKWPWVEANGPSQQEGWDVPINDARTNFHEPMLCAPAHRRPIDPVELELGICQNRQILCSAISAQL